MICEGILRAEMSRLRSAFRFLKREGLLGFCREVVRSVYSCRRMVVLAKTWRPDDAPPSPPEGVRLREATIEDLEAIVAAWPEEFAATGPGGRRLRRLIQERFSEGLPCFVATDRNGLLAAMWCMPWTLDGALPPQHQGRDAYEILNLFTIPAARERGLAGQLLRYGMAQMADRGWTVAYSRILPHRSASLQVHEKTGFRRIGTLVMTIRLGRHHDRLAPLKGT